MKLFAVAWLAIVSSTAALAVPVPAAEAIVEWKHQPEDKIIVDETIWRCTGAICRGSVVEHGPTKVRSCRRLAIYAGAVLSFRTAAGALDARELARCNGRR